MAVALQTRYSHKLLEPAPWPISETNHCATIFDKLKIQREQGRFCDVILKVNGRDFPAHRCVLASCSPWFDTKLKVHKTMKEIIEVESCKNYEVFHLVLTYMYTGRIVLDLHKVADILDISHNYAINKLKVYCSEYLEKNLRTNNCLNVIELSTKYHLSDLTKQTMAFINKHFKHLVQIHEIEKMSLMSFQEFLNKAWYFPSELVLRLVTRWVSHDQNSREENFLNLLHNVNWNSLDPGFITDHLEQEDLYYSSNESLLTILKFLDKFNVVLHPRFTKVYEMMKSNCQWPDNDFEQELDDNNSFLSIAINSLNREDQGVDETFSSWLTGDSGPYGPYRHPSGTDGISETYKQASSGVNNEDTAVDIMTGIDPSPGQGPSTYLSPTNLVKGVRPVVNPPSCGVQKSESEEDLLEQHDRFGGHQTGLDKSNMIMMAETQYRTDNTENVFQTQKPSMLSHNPMRPSPTPSAQPTPSPVNTNSLSFQNSPRQPDGCPSAADHYKTLALNQEAAGTGYFVAGQDETLHQSGDQLHQSSDQLHQSSDQLHQSSDQMHPSSDLMQPSSEQLLQNTEQMDQKGHHLQQKVEQQHERTGQCQENSDQIHHRNDHLLQRSEQIGSDPLDQRKEHLHLRNDQLLQSSVPLDHNRDQMQQSSEQVHQNSDLLLHRTNTLQQRSDELLQRNGQLQQENNQPQVNSDHVSIGVGQLHQNSEQLQPPSEQVQQLHQNSDQIHQSDSLPTKSDLIPQKCIQLVADQDQRVRGNDLNQETIEIQKNPQHSLPIELRGGQPVLVGYASEQDRMPGGLYRQERLATDQLQPEGLYRGPEDQIQLQYNRPADGRAYEAGVDLYRTSQQLEVYPGMEGFRGQTCGQPQYNYMMRGEYGDVQYRDQTGLPDKSLQGPEQQQLMARQQDRLDRLQNKSSDFDFSTDEYQILEQVINEHRMSEERSKYSDRMPTTKRYDPKHRALAEAFRQMEADMALQEPPQTLGDPTYSMESCALSKSDQLGQAQMQAPTKTHMFKSEIKENPDCQFSKPDLGQVKQISGHGIPMTNESTVNAFMDTEFAMKVKETQFVGNDPVVSNTGEGPSSPTSLLTISTCVQDPLQTPEKSEFYPCENSAGSNASIKTSSKSETQQLFLTPKEKYAKEVSALNESNQTQISFDLNQVFETREHDMAKVVIAEAKPQTNILIKPKSKIPLAFKILRAKKKMASQKKLILEHGEVRLTHKQKLKIRPVRKRIQKKLKANDIFQQIEKIDKPSNLLPEDVPLTKRIVNRKDKLLAEHRSQSQNLEDVNKDDIKLNLVEHLTLGICVGDKAIKDPILGTTTSESCDTLETAIETVGKLANCQFCGESLIWNKDYYDHIKEKHIGGPPFRCPQCDYSSPRLQQTLSHYTCHIATKQFSCNHCDFETNSVQSLKKHDKNQHETAAGEGSDRVAVRFFCITCEKSFAHKHTLMQHQAVHSDEKKYKCKLCTFSTKYSSHLAAHKRVHEGNVHRCTFEGCQYWTPKLTLLKAHLRAHNGEKCFKCDICSKGFVEAGQLRRHIKTHSDVKPFQCDIDNCSYSTNRKDKLKEHHGRSHKTSETGVNHLDENLVQRPSKLILNLKPDTPPPDESVFSPSEVPFVKEEILGF